MVQPKGRTMDLALVGWPAITKTALAKAGAAVQKIKAAPREFHR